MRFVRILWRVAVGVKDALVLLFMLLFFGILYAVLSSSPKTAAGDEGALLLAMSGTIVEQPADADPLAVIQGSSLNREYRLRDIVHALRGAATDDRVKAVALDLDIFTGGGQPTLANVGAALDLVRKAKKPVIAFAGAYTDDSYQLAAHADEIWMDPMGTVLIRGPGGANLYYKGLMDRIGVTANVYKVGTYKAATEPFTRNDMSQEARQSLQAVANALWNNWRAEVAKARPKAQLGPFLADIQARSAPAGTDMAQAALKAGMVDRIGDRTDFGRRVAEIVGSEDEDVPGSFRTIDLPSWISSNPADDGDGNIGILTIAGEIVDGKAGKGSAGAESIVDLIEQALSERDLKALVVRIDSPGGSALASERIRSAIVDAKTKAGNMPVVVSMGSVAASGGYWIAAAGDHIYAEPGTITGSIGVFGILPSFENLLAKLGVGADGVKTTPLSGEPDILRGPSPEASALIQAGVEQTYRRFLQLVSASRHMPVQNVDAIAQGRIWDGGAARRLGLVDRFGSE